MTHRHRYAARITWEGAGSNGTASYAGYGRQHRAVIAGKPDLLLSADPAFRGASDLHNPEDLFLAAVAGCHMLTYLALCARAGVVVLAYVDEADGTLGVDADGGGRFESITLRPGVVVAVPEQVDAARSLHDRAHETCFIARSCQVPIRVEAAVGAAPASAESAR